MCLGYLGHPNPTGEQLEDELYQYCENHSLNREAPTDLATLIQRYGYADDLQMNGHWKDIKPWLNKGNPVIVHGDFTARGHIVVIIGYNARGWIVNDPYGEWFSDGYDTNASGAGLTYSYGMMERICHPSGDLWVHYVYKP
ncbi:C39 family peptidase [Leptolyngbya sp. FACHB-321]|uniref:C39 family peptidase n=1 Tax=Leptolyngbya sp. FACHB-321 TaxID=2692807 RepID=UPI0018F03F8C|nr:C39 family peptidase [Leptolyngbya sp. FACHB-321]